LKLQIRILENQLDREWVNNKWKTDQY
jgi:hypothetical protein